MPSENSGVTIGRGLDLDQKMQFYLRTILSNAEIPDNIVELFTQCVGLKGTEAREKIK